MTWTVSVDPGLNKAGVAAWWVKRSRSDTVLYPRGWPAWIGMAGAIYDRLSALNVEGASWVVEVMQYDGRTRGQLTADTLEVQGVACTLLGVAHGLGQKVVSYTPSEWKRALPKNVVQSRLMSGTRLTPSEQSAVDPKATHDAWCAVGIGYRHLRGPL
jgi:hypothetical protein